MSIPKEVYVRVILAHAIPLVGVLLGQWDFLAFVFAYWAETYVISLVLAYIFLLLRKANRGGTGLAVPLTHFLIGVLIFTVVQLALLALLLKSVSAFLLPGRRASLVELFNLFLDHISQFNFVIYALAPICINITFDLSRYVFSRAYEQRNTVVIAVEDILWRILVHCALIVTMAIKVSEGVVDSVVIVLGFFAIKAAAELVVYKERTSSESRLTDLLKDLIPSGVVSEIETAKKKRNFSRTRFRKRKRRQRK
jgi:hypothetical protein